MYAVIKTGGKQYKVAAGDVLKIEVLPEVAVGDEVDFKEVLMVSESGDGIKLGAPFLEGAVVKAKVLREGRHPKIEIIKLKRRKHHLKHQGHRQSYFSVQITDIQAA